MRTRVGPAIAAALITGTLFTLVALQAVRRADGNYSALLHISDRALRSNPQLRDRVAIKEQLVLSPNGYDAQWTYFATFDPLLTRYAHAPHNYYLMMDMPPYRYGRIGHIWLTRLIARDRWRAYPATLVWTVIFGCVWSALALSAIAQHAGRSGWWGAAILLVPGFWQSVQVTLPEPLAAGAVLTGLACAQRRMWWAAAAAFAMALLTRETSAVALVGLCGGLYWRGERRIAVWLLSIALVPVAIWRWHIFNVLSPVFGWDAVAFNPGTFGWPFSGMTAAMSKVLAGTYNAMAPEMSRAAMGLTALVAGGATIAWIAAWKRPSVPTVIAALYAIMAVSLSGDHVWKHPGNVQRTSAELFLWLAVVAATWTAPNATVHRTVVAVLIATGVFLLALAHDAPTIRSALMLLQ